METWLILPLKGVRELKGALFLIWEPSVEFEPYDYERLDAMEEFLGYALERVERHQLRIDLEELGLAFEDASGEHAYYLDLQTGEVLLLSEFMDEAPEEWERWFRFQDARARKRVLEGLDALGILGEEAGEGSVSAESPR